MKNKTNVITIKNIFFFLLIMVSVASLVQGMPKESRTLVTIEIPADYKKVEAGSSILTQTEIILIKEEYDNKVFDIPIEYSIKDHRGNIIMKITETKGIMDRLFTVKELMLPSDLFPGVYTLTVKAAYAGKSGSETASFEVVKKKAFLFLSLTEKEVIILTILLILFMITFIVLYKTHHNIKTLEREK